MKPKLHLLLFLFSSVSFLISLYQFIDGRIMEGILSVIYSAVFFAAGIYNKAGKNKEKSIEKKIL